ncbi:hypothetical protein KY363_06285 [Candidatus Woesearchaeota archaeon]|nr:hypothetical protein [Candidatus Woesearchaeota archaeon]
MTDLDTQNQDSQSQPMQTKSREELEQILVNDPHVTSYIPAEQIDFPPVNYANFHERDCGMVRDLVEQLQLDISGAYILIDFPDHAQRREWIDSMTEQHGGAFLSLVERNLLRINVLGRLAGRQILEPLMHSYEGRRWAELSSLSRQISAAYDVVSGFEMPYDRLTADEKIDFARSLKQTYLRILEIFADKNE